MRTDRPERTPPGSRRGRGAGRSVRPTILGLTAALLVLPGALLAQAEGAAARSEATEATIDTIILERSNVFTSSEADEHFVYRALNALHVVTRPYVIRRELLLESGQPYDSARGEESERNLRRRRLFRSVEIDTVTVDGRLALRVRTADAWSTRPRLELAVASNGAITGTVGVTEFNLLGTGIPVTLGYRKFVDRDGFEIGTAISRAFGTSLFAAGAYQGLSDQRRGDWRVGVPFYSLSDDWALEYGGESFDGRILQYRATSPASRDTTVWYRRATAHRVQGAVAPLAEPGRYLRIGATAEYREDETFPVADTSGLVPDSVYGLVGAFLEYRRAEFEVTRYLNGFTEEDQDLSEVIFLGLKLAPAGWGYGRTGVGPRIVLQAGGRVGRTILKGVIDANALYNGAGLDSGRVTLRLSAGAKPGARHALLLSALAGVRENPAPGDEFDLGFPVPPRLWEPHSFSGTRSARAVVEHRWYALDDLWNLLGLGVAGFVDYGGAWYEDQDARFGGNVGLALLLGSPLSALAEHGQLALGYRFGSDVVGERWVVSFGSGFFF